MSDVDGEASSEGPASPSKYWATAEEERLTNEEADDARDDDDATAAAVAASDLGDVGGHTSIIETDKSR